MNFLRLTALLIYTFGVLSFGTMSVLWLRQRREARWVGKYGACPVSSRTTSRVGGAMTLFCFVWFVVCLLLVLVSLDPEIRPWPLLSVKLVLTFFFPALIMHTTYAEVEWQGGVPPRRAWRIWIGLTYLVGAACTVFSLLGFYRYLAPPISFFSTFTNISIAALFTNAAVYGSLAISRSKKKMTTTADWSHRRWLYVLFGAVSLLCIGVVFAQLGWFELPDALVVVLHSIPLAFLFVGTYYENRFEFFDLFIKRGLSLLLTIVLLTAYFTLIFPRLQAIEFAWAEPWVYAVALLPVALALPWLHRRLSHWLDSVWLGRRFSTVQAVKYFLAALQSATSERHLIQQAERGLSSIFQAPTRIEVGPREIPSPEFEVVLEVPVQSGGERIGALRLAERANHTPFFSEDVALLASLADVLSYMLENVRLQQRKQEHEQLAKERALDASRSELKALRAQINPHFLFNALNAIAGLIHKDPARADQTVEQLAEVFRYTLSRSESEWAALAEEMEFVRAYLEVEQARFGPRLQFALKMEEDAEALRIPSMMVQTLVENAVKHGIAAVRGAGKIEVSARRRDGRLEIEVADNGPGFSMEEERPSSRPAPKNSGYGLRNVRQRLTGYFGEEAALKIHRDPEREMTVVSIHMPILPAAPGRADPEKPARTGGAI